MNEDVVNDLHHTVALVALVEEAMVFQNWPDLRLTQDRANRLYEKALTEKPESTDR